MHFAPHLYLDPGSGSFLIQLLFATLAGLGIVAIASWNRIKSWFGIKSKPKVDEDDDDTDE
ncbi:MAG: hypothetical protein ACM3XO_00570 [Bacteroidota bacterium]|jgi:hypothetical protein